MRPSKLLFVSLLAIGMLAGTSIVRADTTEATCEVRKDGDKQKGKSGPCTFSQRQGYIDIDLKNGDTIRLSPAGNANHYRDQHGNKVAHTSAGSTGMSLKWENGKHPGHSSGRDYGINPLDDGSFEVVSSNPFCTVRFKKHGEVKHCSEECTPEHRRESVEYAQRYR